jgi:hypothetical protein
VTASRRPTYRPLFDSKLVRFSLLLPGMQVSAVSPWRRAAAAAAGSTISTSLSSAVRRCQQPAPTRPSPSHGTGSITRRLLTSSLPTPCLMDCKHQRSNNAWIQIQRVQRAILQLRCFSHVSMQMFVVHGFVQRLQFLRSRYSLFCFANKIFSCCGETY